MLVPSAELHAPWLVRQSPNYIVDVQANADGPGLETKWGTQGLEVGLQCVLLKENGKRKNSQLGHPNAPPQTKKLPKT
eukprot:516701-Amphidinium_carterae.1